MYLLAELLWRSCSIDILVVSCTEQHHQNMAAQGHWQGAGNRGMHHYIRMQLSALALSPSRPGHAGRQLIISGLLRRGESSAAMCGSRGVPRQPAHHL